MTLTGMVEYWIGEAERMNQSRASSVVVAPELFEGLAHEQRKPSPAALGLEVRVAASNEGGGPEGRPVTEMVEISGPDRLSVYVGAPSAGQAYPLGYDPAMPVFFVPFPEAPSADSEALEMYNRLRWYGLSPEEARAGSSL